MIKTIFMQNIKGTSRKQLLTGRDIFVGPNGAGKTTNLQAVGLSMLGYVPGEGKTLSETFKLSTGPEMVVGIELDQFKFTRKFIKSSKEDKKSGEVKTEITQDISIAPSMGEKTNTLKEGRIAVEVGSFPVMLDFNSFLELSDSKRREFFYNLSPISADSWNRDVVQKYLEKNLLSKELKLNNPDKYKAVEECIKDAMSSYPLHFDTQKGLAAMIDYVSNKLSFWKKEETKAEGAVSKLTDIKNKLEESDRGIANNKAELESLQTQLNNVIAQISGDAQKKKVIDAHNENINTTKASIAEWTEKTCADDVKQLQGSIDDLKKKYTPVTDWEKVRADLVLVINNLKVTLENLQSDYNACKQLITSSENDMQNYMTALEQITSVESKRSEAKPAGRCVINPKISCDKDFGNFLEFANTHINSAQSDIDKNKLELESISKKITETKKELADKENEKEQSFTSEKNEIAYNTDLNEQILKLEGRMSTANSFDKTKSNELGKLNKALEKLIATPMEAICDIALAESQKAGIITNIAALKLKISGQEEAKQTLVNLQTSMVDDKVAGYNADGYKLIADSIGPKGVQGEIVKSILEPIRSDIQDKLTQLDLSHEFYFSTESDTGKEVFQFGWYNEKGNAVNFDALSGGEKILLLICILVTMVERKNPKLRVLMIDEIQNLDSKNFFNVITALNTIGTNLDNIILSGVVDHYCMDEDGNGVLIPADNMAGFKVWYLGKDGDDE